MEVNTAAKSKINVVSHDEIMAFDQYHYADQGTFVSPYKYQTILTECSDRLLQPPLSSHPFCNSSQPEEITQSSTSWQAQENPYQLVDCAQRNAADGNEYGSQSDLYGLVSDILEETDRMDSYFADEIPSNVKSVWSPNSVKEDSLQYFQAESSIQEVSHVLQMYPDPCIRGQRQPDNTDSQQGAKFRQGFNGFEINNQWLSSSSSKEQQQVQDLQTMPRMPSGTCFPPKTRPGKSDSIIAVKDDGFYSVNPIFNHTNMISSSGCMGDKINSQFFSVYSDFSNENQLKLNGSRQTMMQENKVANSTPKLLVTEEDTFFRDCQKSQMGQMCCGDHVSDQHSSSFSRRQPLESQAGQFKKEIVGDLEVSRTPDHAVEVPASPSAYCPEDFSRISQQQSLSGAFSPVASFQSKHPMQKTNSISANLNQYVHSPLTQYENQATQLKNSSVPDSSKTPLFSISDFAPQNLEKNTLCPQDYNIGDGQNQYSRAAQNQAIMNLEELQKASNDSEFDHLVPGSLVNKVHQLQSTENIKAQISSHHERVKKQEILQNAYLDFFANVCGLHKSFGTSANTLEKKQSPPIFPNMHLMGDLRQTPWSLQWNNGSYSQRPTFPHGHPVTSMDRCSLLPGKESSSCVPVMSIENPVPIAASMIGFPSIANNHCSPTSQFHSYLEECYEQWKLLEKERKKTEDILTKSFPGKRISIASTSPIPKVPQNPSRFDRLIVDQLREQVKVVGLLEKMECLRNIPLPPYICLVLDRHHEAIYITQARRKDELINISNRQRQQGPYFLEDRGILLLAAATKDLCGTTRKCRTALWCALQMTLPQMENKSDEQREKHT